MTEQQIRSVPLNDVADLIRLMRENPDLSSVLGEELESGCTNCHGCKGSNSALMERFLPLNEQLVLKKERLRALQQQIEEAERQLGHQQSSRG